MKYICLIMVVMLTSCLSTKQIKPIKPLVIEPVAEVSETVDPVVSVVSDQVNVETPANVFGLLVMTVFLVCAACGFIPGLIRRVRGKGQTDQASERVVLND